MGDRPNIDLQVLPFSAGAHAGIMGSFVLFSFSTAAFSDVACVAFDSLRSSALSASESLDLLTRVIREL